jgi:RHS repeat-associated protein
MIRSIFTEVATHHPLATLLVLSLTSLLPLPVSAQVATGTPAFGSFAGGPDVVNLGNLNTHNSFHVFRRDGRAGLNFSYDLGYDSAVWFPVGASGSQSWYPAQNFGWLGQTQILTGYISYSASFTQRACYVGQQVLYTSWWLYQNWAYYEPFGAPHGFSGGTQVFTSTACGQSPIIFANGAYLTASATDNSGYTLNANGGTGIITTPTNATFAPPAQSTTGAGSVTDRNGNQMNVNSSGVFTDTLGTTALTVTGSGTPTSPMKFTYTAPNGSPVAVQINYTQYTVATNFGVSGISEYGANSQSLPSSIVLPDGSSYSIAYEPTPSVPSAGACTPLSGTTSCVTARIASISLPTGGTITYSYSGGNNGIFSDGSTATLTRTLSDGAGWSATWTYARSQFSGAHWQTLITDPTTPTANQTLIDFQKDSGVTANYYEEQRQVYQGFTSGTLLQTVSTCYNGAASPCTGTTVASPINRRTEIIQYPNSGGKQCKHDFFYNTNGLVTEVDDYDYGSGSVGSLIRKALTTYSTTVVGLPATVTVQDGSGTTKAQTTYSYDQTTPTAPPGTTPQHQAATGYRGNATTIAYLVQGTTTISRTFTYWDTGMVKTATDVNGAATSYNYPDATSTCGNAFPTGITLPSPNVTISRSYAWNCTGGVLTSVTDENSRVTSTTYNDAYFWRPASVTFPDTGQTSWTYNSPTSVTTTTKMNASQNIVRTLLLDGLGRTSQTQLNSDPQGVNYSVVTYNALGNVNYVYNPTYCNPPTTNCGSSAWPNYPWGVTSYQYDALGRATSVTLQDGSVATASYSNNTVTATDPAGKKRQSTFDGLGRITQVTEDPGGLGYVTTYGYDTLSNLISVTQNGGRQRTFTYDALSRLVCESNPEIQVATCPNPDNGSYTAGTIRYSYDNNNNLTSRQAPAPNQTGSATVTITYAHDLLHRLTQKSYSDGTTPASNFYYDQQAPWGWNLSNYIGRLTTESTSSGTANLYNYDPLGRPILYESCTPLNCSGTSYAVQFSYDLAGNITSIPVSKGSNFFTPSYGYDSAGRPVSITSNFVDSQHPATLATVDASAGYYPNGAIAKMTYGNGVTQATVIEPRLQPCAVNFNSSGSGPAVIGGCAGISNPPSGTIQGFGFSYGSWGSTNSGNVTEMDAAGAQAFTRSFAYDSLNRLATLNQSGGSATGCSATFNLSWTYDAWGNRTDQTVNSGTCNPFHATVNTKNQLVDPINNKYQYDSAGNMIQDANHTYFYDAENRLAQVDGTFGTCSTATVCYLYDAEGRRAESNYGSSQMDFLRDLSGNVVADWETSSGYTGWATGYVYLNGGLLAQYQGSTTHFAHADHLGSTRLLTGLDQSVVQNLDFLPFGELNSSDSGINNHKFTGDERDSETSLDHTWFRQYSSSLGRWMHPDPAGFAAVDPTNPQSWNRYSYVLNNPLMATDPFGLECVWDDGSYDSIDDPKTGSLEGCAGAGGTWIDHSFFGDFGLPDWSPSQQSDLTSFLAGVVSDIQAGFALVQTGSGLSGWMLVANGGAGPIDWSLLGPQVPTMTYDQQAMAAIHDVFAQFPNVCSFTFSANAGGPNGRFRFGAEYNTDTGFAWRGRAQGGIGPVKGRVTMTSNGNVSTGIRVGGTYGVTVGLSGWSITSIGASANLGKFVSVGASAQIKKFYACKTGTGNSNGAE